MVCPVEQSNEETGTVNIISGQKEATLWIIVEELGAELTEEEKRYFYQLFVDYAYIIASSTTDLGQTKKLKHMNHTGDAAPI